MTGEQKIRGQVYASETLEHDAGVRQSDPGNSRWARIRSRAIDCIRNHSSRVSLWLSSLARNSFVWGKPSTPRHRNELEDSSNCADSSLLPDCANVPRGSAGILGDDSDAKEGVTDGRRRSSRNSRGRGINNVATKILSSHKFTKILYGGPRRDSIKIKVESSAPVNVYGVTAGGLSEFRENRHYDLFGFEKKTKLREIQSLPIDSNEDWYLILENKSSEPVAVHYEVFDV